MLELSNPALASTLRASRGGRAVRHRASHQDLAGVTKTPRRVSIGALETVQAAPEPQEAPEGTVVSPNIALFEARASEHASISAKVPVPLPVRRSRGLEWGYGGKDAYCL